MLNWRINTGYWGTWMTKHTCQLRTKHSLDNKASIDTGLWSYMQHSCYQGLMKKGWKKAVKELTMKIELIKTAMKRAKYKNRSHQNSN
jgi:hypothetical protein